MLKSVFKSKKVIISTIIILFLLASIITGIVASSTGTRTRVKQKLELGEKYLSEMKYEEAILVFKEVIEIEPRNVQAYLGISEAYVALEQPEEAITWLETGISCIEEHGEVIEGCEELYIRASEIHESMDNNYLAEAVLERGYRFTGLEIFLELLERIRDIIEAGHIAEVVNIENDNEIIEEDMDIGVYDEINETKLKEYLIVETSVASGTYNQPQSIELTSGGAKIYYTLDGSDPNDNSDIYIEEIILSYGEYILKAISEDRNGNRGEVIEFSYIIEKEDLEEQFELELNITPTIILTPSPTSSPTIVPSTTPEKKEVTPTPKVVGPLTKEDFNVGYRFDDEIENNFIDSGYWWITITEKFNGDISRGIKLGDSVDDVINSYGKSEVMMLKEGDGFYLCDLWTEEHPYYYLQYMYKLNDSIYSIEFYFNESKELIQVFYIQYNEDDQDQQNEERKSIRYALPPG